jgi:2-amino-4-hydroxy-6-hydroxymethyldihydropteridine diphosphokinase
MILVALGANLPHERWGSPRATCEAALQALERAGMRVVARSRWYRSLPQPPAAQPEFVNAVVALETELAPAALLAALHAIEVSFGRRRGAANAARTIDLDLIAYHDRVSDGADGGPVLPHPRLGERAFVLRPLADVAPDWRHPASGRSVAAFLAALPPGAEAAALA